VYSTVRHPLPTCTHISHPAYLLFIPHGMILTHMEPNNTAVVTATNRNILLEILTTGTSKNAIATKAGISTSTFHRKVTGKTDFTLRELGKVATALDLKLTDLIKDAA
jgi:DNA-binding phage protein